MPEEVSDEELGLPEGLDPNIRAELRKSRQLARDNEASNKRNAQLERELAFSKAGIPDTPLVQTLAKSYEGENDPAAVKAYFEGLGVDLGSPAAKQQEEFDDLEAQRRLAQVGAQGDTGGAIRYEDALNSAKDVKEVMALLASAPEGATDYDGRRIGVPRID